ncbi:hypothetical protein [Vescimonas sp.]|uniref:hypothetical protein n=1 Tax=Vescimonas sp. TaxID=2892404 RepID=UPI00307C732A
METKKMSPAKSPNISGFFATQTAIFLCTKTQMYGGESQKSFDTPYGKRYVDQYSNKDEKDYLDQANTLTGGKVTYTIGK